MARVILSTTYPVGNVILSALTTALISFKIGQQYVVSARNAGPSADVVRLRSVMGMMIVESTMLSTVQQVVVCVLLSRNNPMRYLFQGTLVPCIGTYTYTTHTIGGIIAL